MNEILMITKRDGTKQEFNGSKIFDAIKKANNELEEDKRVSEGKLRVIAGSVIEKILVEDGEIGVEDIQDLVERELVAFDEYELSRKYIRYRYKRELVRETNTTDKTILELLNGTNDYWNKENSNKDAKIVTTQRDYLAGITSTDIAKRFLLPRRLVEAHEQGILHFHDIDYFAQHSLHNCELINLDDMLQNGTMVNNVLIEKPHRFLTAMTIATQIITAVTSSSYGGATITLTHLAPFVRDSYNGYLKKYCDLGFDEETCLKLAEIDTRKEIKDGVQTFNYQCNSMSNSNGQAPFLSVAMYLGETSEFKEELALIIQEFLEQRILGMKNEKGVYITPAFPKLLYVLEEDNIHEGSKYWYLTELAAKCTAKRMVPDYISEKIMKEYKINGYGIGECYPCMGKRKL